ncbi:FAD:protein FMN transferase [Bacteroidota bacterium]
MCKLFVPGRKFVIFVSLLFTLSCTSEIDDSLYSISGNTMGTTYSIKIARDNETKYNTEFENLKEKIDSILIVVNQQMSTYIDTSEISLFNKLHSNQWFNVSPDLAFVISTAKEISQKSSGAFDITIGPLVNLWGFGPELKVYDVPAASEIEKMKRYVGFHNVSVSIEKSALMKKIPQIYCDLSAIAKGFGVDKVALYLESLNVKNYLVEIGGEVRTKGINKEGKTWQIGISSPDNNLGIEKIAALKNASMATSGDYRNYFEKDNVRYSHTIDPRTGYPIAHRLASVTVIHDSCIVADAFATAITVLGPDDGYKLAVKEKLPVFFIIRDEKGFVEKMTPEFQAFLN